MVRTQIQITPEQASRLRRMAAARGVSLAELIREGIDLLLRESVMPDEGSRRRRAIKAAGRFRSGPRDLSRRHDAHLAEAYSQ